MNDEAVQRQQKMQMMRDMRELSSSLSLHIKLLSAIYGPDYSVVTRAEQTLSEYNPDGHSTVEWLTEQRAAFNGAIESIKSCRFSTTSLLKFETRIGNIATHAQTNNPSTHAWRIGNLKCCEIIFEKFFDRQDQLSHAGVQDKENLIRLDRISQRLKNLEEPGLGFSSDQAEISGLIDRYCSILRDQVSTLFDEFFGPHESRKVVIEDQSRRNPFGNVLYVEMILNMRDAARKHKDPVNPHGRVVQEMLHLEWAKMMVIKEAYDTQKIDPSLVGNDSVAADKMRHICQLTTKVSEADSLKEATHIAGELREELASLIVSLLGTANQDWVAQALAARMLEIRSRREW